MIIVVGNGHSDTSSNPGWGFYRAIIPLGKVWIQLFSLLLRVTLVLIRQPVKQKENSEFKPVKLCLKFTLFRILPGWRGCVNTYLDTRTQQLLPLEPNTSVLADQQKITFIIAVPLLAAV